MSCFRSSLTQLTHTALVAHYSDLQPLFFLHFFHWLLLLSASASYVWICYTSRLSNQIASCPQRRFPPSSSTTLFFHFLFGTYHAYLSVFRMNAKHTYNEQQQRALGWCWADESGRGHFKKRPGWKKRQELFWQWRLLRRGDTFAPFAPRAAKRDNPQLFSCWEQNTK